MSVLFSWEIWDGVYTCNMYNICDRCCQTWPVKPSPNTMYHLSCSAVVNSWLRKLTSFPEDAAVWLRCQCPATSRSLHSCKPPMASQSSEAQVFSRRSPGKTLQTSQRYASYAQMCFVFFWGKEKTFKNSMLSIASRAGSIYAKST